jgi:hypothetical protein
MEAVERSIRFSNKRKEVSIFFMDHSIFFMEAPIFFMETSIKKME